MSRAWAVHERVPKFSKSYTTGDINRIARKAAKEHREKFGRNPIKKIPDDSVNDNDLIDFPVYHYKDEGLKLLDSVIIDYFKENLLDDNGNKKNKLQNPNDMNDFLKKQKKPIMKLIIQKEERNGWNIDEAPF